MALLINSGVPSCISIKLAVSSKFRCRQNDATIPATIPISMMAITGATASIARHQAIATMIDATTELASNPIVACSAIRQAVRRR